MSFSHECRTRRTEAHHQPPRTREKHLGQCWRLPSLPVYSSVVWSSMQTSVLEKMNPMQHITLIIPLDLQYNTRNGMGWDRWEELACFSRSCLCTFWGFAVGFGISTVLSTIFTTLSSADGNRLDDFPCVLFNESLHMADEQRHHLWIIKETMCVCSMFYLTSEMLQREQRCFSWTSKPLFS